MGFYEVWVRSNRYHGNEALTYSSQQQLSAGAIVRVPMQRETVPGVVTKVVSKPKFATKPISFMYDLPAVPTTLLRLTDWLRAYYPAPLGIVAQQLIPAGLLEDSKIIAAKSSSAPSTKLPPLTNEQSDVLQKIDHSDTYLLHGKTGSGKTRIYSELAQRSLTDGKSALILTPEISLTSQLVNRFKAIFGEQVVLLHSQLTPKERREAWLKLLGASEPLVVIGPRSALFSPLKNIGLIVLDESHEPAYKQEQAPHYHASRVAAQLRNLHDATLVLGSATPSIGDYFLAEQKDKPILTLTQLAQQTSDLPSETTIIDLKDRSFFTRTAHLSTPLISAMQEALARGEQSLLYLNRRGTARTILCENCGWQALCPHCDLPLTYHGDAHELRCHVCNYHQPSPSVCPECKHTDILFKTIGTKAIVDEVQRLFPNARVARFDTDNLKAERFEQQFDAIHAGEVDILVGTQLIAKGLDLPRLSVLGIVAADSSLQMPDFTASERTYQLLTQVLGRVGRGHVASHTFIQTYQPDNPILQAAVSGDWDSFYTTELQERKLFNFPPYTNLLKLTVRRASFKAAEKAAQEFASKLQKSGLKIIIDGPAPAFHEKLVGKYQWQLIVKSAQRSELLKVIKLLPTNWSYDIDPIDLL